MSYFRHGLCAVSLAALTSCATIVAGDTDKITVTPSGTDQAVCRLKNNKGDWVVNAPGSVEVEKSRRDLSIHCDQAHTGATGALELQSNLENWTFGNILLGGIIGLAVDWGTGSLWEYPEEVTINMSTPARAMPEQTPVPRPAAVSAPQQTPAPSLQSEPRPRYQLVTPTRQ